jgi:hypothetical protein
MSCNPTDIWSATPVAVETTILNGRVPNGRVPNGRVPNGRRGDIETAKSAHKSEPTLGIERP